MRDSNLAYIGQIPNNWKLIHLGRLCSEVQNLNLNCEVNNALQFKMGNIISKNGGDSKYHPETLEGYNIVSSGDLIINGLNLNYDLKSYRVGQVCEEGVITSAYIAIRPKQITPDYFKFLMKGFDYIKTFHGMGKGIRLTLSYEELRRMYIPVPPIDEQSRIASFLDSHIAKIDDSIARYKVLSDKLNEYRKAVITKAITQGIRGERPMKDSCEVWIGQIPSEWSVVKIKYLVSLSGERAETNDGYLSMENVESWTGKFVNTGASAEGDTLKIFPGQVIFGKLRPYLAKAYSVKQEGCCSGEFLVFNIGSINACYFRYGLTTTTFVNRVDVSTYGTKMPRANAGFITNLLFPVPPEDEQAEIVAYLDKKCSDIDRSKSKIETVVKKLEEYKKSLIYNAVTGKIEC